MDLGMRLVRALAQKPHTQKELVEYVSDLNSVKSWLLALARFGLLEDPAVIAYKQTCKLAAPGQYVPVPSMGIGYLSNKERILGTFALLFSLRAVPLEMAVNFSAVRRHTAMGWFQTLEALGLLCVVMSGDKPVLVCRTEPEAGVPNYVYEAAEGMLTEDTSKLSASAQVIVNRVRKHDKLAQAWHVQAANRMIDYRKSGRISPPPTSITQAEEDDIVPEPLTKEEIARHHRLGGFSIFTAGS